jgi:hypothetical protein
MLVNILGIIDDATCYEVVRPLRWPDGVRCAHCASARIVKQGRDETEPHRRRYECRSRGRRFDDLTETIFAGHHQPLKVWVLVLDLMGLDLSNEPIAKELDLDPDDAPRMTTGLREGVALRRPEVTLKGGDARRDRRCYIRAGFSRTGAGLMRLRGNKREAARL